MKTVSKPVRSACLDSKDNRKILLKCDCLENSMHPINQIQSKVWKKPNTVRPSALLVSRFKRLSRRGQWWNHLESRPAVSHTWSRAFLSVLRSQSVQQERSVTRDGREAEHGGRAIRNRTVLRFGLAALSRGDSILLVPCVRTYIRSPADHHQEIWWLQAATIYSSAVLSRTGPVHPPLSTSCARCSRDPHDSSTIPTDSKPIRVLNERSHRLIVSSWHKDVSIFRSDEYFDRVNSKLSNFRYSMERYT